MAAEAHVTENHPKHIDKSHDIYKNRNVENCFEEELNSNAAPKNDPEFTVFFDRVMQSLYDRGFSCKNL